MMISLLFLNIAASGASTPPMTARGERRGSILVSHQVQTLSNQEESHPHRQYQYSPNNRDDLEQENSVSVSHYSQALEKNVKQSHNPAKHTQETDHTPTNQQQIVPEAQNPQEEKQPNNIDEEQVSDCYLCWYDFLCCNYRIC